MPSPVQESRAPAEVARVLQASETCYHTIFHEMLDGCVLYETIYDAQGQPVDYRFLVVNPAFERLTGRTAADLIGKCVREVLPGIEAYWFNHFAKVSKTGEATSFANYAREMDKYLQVTAYRPAPDQLAVIFIDVTEHKLAESYREMGRELLLVFAAADDDRRTMIQRALDILKAHTGYDAVGFRLQENEDFPYFTHAGFSEEFLRQENSLLARDPQGQLCRYEDGRARLVCTCGLVLSGQTDPTNPLFTKGGSCWTNNSLPLLDLTPEQDPRRYPRNACVHQGYLSVALIPIRKGDRILGLIHLADRRPGRFTLERIELLEGIAATLGETIVRKQAETERELMAAQLRQAEKLQAVGQLAGGIAHDFNNQLGGIVGFAELLADRLEEPTLKGYAEKILDAATHATNLTRQLLAFSRKGRYISVPTDIHKTIAEVVELLQRSIDKRIEIKRHLEATPALVLADPTQLQNTILNLGLNARDAMPQGGEILFATQIVPIVDAQPPEELKPGPYVLISVTDTGIGMDTATLNRLFEPFFTTKESGKGTGLGLASAYRAVKNHGGMIRVTSQVGHGSTFCIYLPLAPEVTVVAPEPAHAPPPLPAGQGRILLVDDEPIILELAATMLRKDGYKVIACGNPQEALELYRKEWRNLDLVLLDMVMPKLGGRELFLAMRKINPAIKAILASGYSLNGDAQQILNLGVLAFMQKPFRRTTLTQKVAEALKAHPRAPCSLGSQLIPNLLS